MRPPRAWDDIGPYDEATSDEDLWFLPGPMDDDLPPGAPPLPVADRRVLFDPEDWRRVQDGLSADLARLTQLFGELDVRLRSAPEGLRHRLALAEAADLSWWAGDRLPAERLGLWVALRIGSTEDTGQALARAGWAMRRLTGGPMPADGLAPFLERTNTTEPETIADLAGVLASVGALHPVTQAAMLFHAWRMIGGEHSRDLEAAVLAARHAATIARVPGRGALFLPLATGSSGALRGHGTLVQKLSAWITGAEQATLSALLHLDRVEEWRRRADAAIADLSGRVPALLLDTLQAWPLVPAPLAEAETGASRAAIQRNLDRLVARGLIREITGHGRFRVWTAMV